MDNLPALESFALQMSSNPSSDKCLSQDFNQLIPTSEDISYADSESSLCLSWRNILYQVDLHHNEETILKGVSGYAKSGTLTVLMGSSGAGKTTLLDIIAGRIRASDNTKISGEILLNGAAINVLSRKHTIAYVTQEDVLLPYLTVKESLSFIAKLSMPGPSEKITEKVDQIIKKLKLGQVSDNLIGSVIVKGISGGERKRVSIGMELISDPQIVILDEPTSGLDSFTAEVLIDVLLDLSRDGKIVISTLHQPSSSIFNKIDKLILLSNGCTVYDGPSSKSRKYFSKLGFSCPKLTNPADYYMNLLHIIDRKNMTEEEKNILNTLTSVYETKDIIQNIPIPSSNSLAIKSPQKISNFRKFCILCDRGFINARRNPGALIAWLMLLIVIWVLTDLLFHDLGNDFHSIQNINGVLYFITMNAIMSGNAYSAMGIPSERPIYLKEYNKGIYGTFIYILAKLISELPFHLLGAAMTALMLYFALDLNLNAGKFFIFCLIFFLGHQMGGGLGYIVGAMCKTQEIALAISQIFVAPLNAYGGMISMSRLNYIFSWITYFSPFYYTFQAFTVNQYTDMNFNCDPNGPKCDPLDDLEFDFSIEMCIMAIIIYAILTRLISLIVLKILGAKQK
ncbi:unnamed protein product [Blepharisma stoltei]|uniref:ABC transporter domain-containing protein n=1 Tax=Blepharisma stoltei TaxID=1481888 RepID=A0AAU9K621_9CILI|nr:unnamed protein product [Blepharisma stoltei]